MSTFYNKVVEVIHKVPYGKVASYGQIALFSGYPGAARAVGSILKSLEIDTLKSEPNIPWWRIVNNSGRVSIKGSKFHNAQTQAKLLRKEGVNVSNNLTFNIEKYRWRPDIKEITSIKLDDEIIEKIISKFLL